MYLYCCFWKFDLQTLITCLGVFVAIIAIWFAGYHLRLQVWILLQKIFTEKDFTIARSTVFNLYRKDMPDEFNKYITDAIKMVCRKMDEFCHITPFLGEKK